MLAKNNWARAVRANPGPERSKPEGVFRPAIPAGTKGCGVTGILSLEAIRKLVTEEETSRIRGAEAKAGTPLDMLSQIERRPLIVRVVDRLVWQLVHPGPQNTLYSSLIDALCSSAGTVVDSGGRNKYPPGKR